MNHAGLGAGALMGLLLTGCGSDGTRSSPPAGLGSGSPNAGGDVVADDRLRDVVYTMTGHVAAGGESQSCQYVYMPRDRGGELAIPRAESHYTPGSHHFLVFRTNFTELPDDGKIHECSVNDLLLNVSGTYYEAQTPDAERTLPPGVAHVFRPGEVILLTAHYLNTTDQDLDTHVEFRMHLENRNDVEQEAGSFFFYNYLINVPPQSHVTVTRQCPIPDDVNLALLWSHMHSRGVAFEATTDDAKAAARVGKLYESETWAEPAPRDFPYDPPVTIRAGSTITYSCTYDNPSSNTYVQGPSAATNEMCILHGMYWPRMDAIAETCAAGVAVDPPP